MMLEDLRNHPAAKWLWLLGGLLVANVAYYIYQNWGLVTVKAKDEPLGQIIHSIEWQSWVKVYTNLPLDTKVTMFADHVPLAEAMETLAANVDVPAPAAGADDGARDQRRVGLGGNPPPAGGGPAPGSGGGPPGGRGGGGGFGQRAEWNLAFFVGPTAAAVRQEIALFQVGDPAIDAKVYSYRTPMQTIADENVMTAPDPHSQSWPGYKAPDLAAAPPVTGSATTGNEPTDPPAPSGPPTVQTYWEAFSQAANIWIMATGSWAPEVANPPAPDSSIIRAVKNLAGSAHGYVTEAIVLRAGRGGPRGGGGPGNDTAWEDRMRNAISGLPTDQRPEALTQLGQEIDFRKQLQALPADERRQKMFEHFAERMLYADHSRLSPEKRAKMYKRMVATRQAAKAQP